MSTVFGKNLRLLSSQRQSLARVAEDLGISRVQFQRYLRGESFPKPNLLRRICIYFDVDARIMLDPLTDRLMADMRTARHVEKERLDTQMWQIGLQHALPDYDYFGAANTLSNGLHGIWRHSFLRPGMIVRTLVQVSEHQGVKLLRGYDAPQLYPKGTPIRLREYRGLTLRMPNGYALLFFHAHPQASMSVAYIGADIPLNLPDHWYGFAAIARSEVAGVGRASRLVMRKMPTRTSDLLRMAHEPAFLLPSEVPLDIREYLSRPGI